MRVDALLGLVGLSSAQQYPYGSSPGTPSGGDISDTGPGSGSGHPTCPFGPATVFITVTPAVLPTVVSTVVSTLTIAVSPSPGSPGQGGSATVPFYTSYVSSGTGTLSWPTAGLSRSNPGSWSTGFLTLTLPPAPGQVTSNVVTYTIVSPQSYNPSNTNSGTHLQTITVTGPGVSGLGTGGSGGTPGETGPPLIISTVTAPFIPSNGGSGIDSGTPYLGTSPTSPLVSIVTETIPAGGPGNSGTANSQPTGNPYTTGNYPSAGSPYTLTVTAPNGGNSVAYPSSSGGVSPMGPNGPGGQGGASIVPGPFSGPFGISSSPSQTLAPFSPSGGISPSYQYTETASNVGGGSGGGNPLPTITITFPGGSAIWPSGSASESQPWTLTVTAPNGSPTSPNGGSGESQPWTLTVTALTGLPTGPNGGAGENSPPTVTATGPNGSSTSSNGGLNGLTTNPGGPGSPGSPGESQPWTITITEPNELPTNSNGGPNGLPTIPNGGAGGPEESQPVTVTVTAPNGLQTGLNSGAGEAQPLTITVTASNGLSTGPIGGAGAPGGSQPLTITVTAPIGVSAGPNAGPNAGSNAGTGGSQPWTLTITVPNGTPTGPNSGAGETKPLPTLTITAPNGLSTSSSGSGGSSQPLPTLTVTAPNGLPVGPTGGVSESELLPTLTVTLPGQSPTGYGGSPQGVSTGSAQGPGGPGAPGGNQSLPTVTVTAGAGSSGGPGESQPLSTVTVTAGTGNGEGPGESQPLPTLTLTIPGQSATGGEESPVGSQPPQTFTITIPAGSPSRPGESQPLETLTITLPASPSESEGQDGPQTITVTASGGSSINQGPSGQPTSSCDENESSSVSGGPWSPSQPTDGPSGQGSQPSGPWSPFSTGSEGGGSGSLSNGPWSPSQSNSGQSGSLSFGPWPGSAGSPSTTPCDEGEPGSQTSSPSPPFQTPGSPGGTGQSGSPSNGPWPPFSAGGEGGQSVFPSNSPWSSSQTSGGQLGSTSNGPWSPSQITSGQPGSPSSGPWPESGNPGGPLISITSTSSIPSGSDTAGSPFPVITLTLSNFPFGPSNGVNGGSSIPSVTQSNTANPAGPASSASVGEGSPSGEQGGPLGGPFESSGILTTPVSQGTTTDTTQSGGYGAPPVSETTFLPQESGDTTANSNLFPSTTPAPSVSGVPGTGASGSPLPISTAPPRGPFSSLPSSGWNFSTSASQEAPGSESTSSAVADSNPSETTSCTDSTTELALSVSVPPMPSFPPPVSPALISSQQVSTATSPIESVSAGVSADGSGSETPVSCLSMTTMVISTMTFSWCEQVAPSTAAGVSTVGQSSTQGGGSTIANPMSPSSGPGGYEFDSAPVGQRSPAKNDILHSPVVRAPSTFATIIIPSRSREEEFLPSETAFCGSPSDLGNFTQNFDDFPPQDVQGGKPKPLFEPYHRIWYSEGFAVMSPPESPFSPSSGNLMIQYIPSSISNISVTSGYPDTAEIGVGPQMFATCFSFNFTGVSFGCDSNEAPCSVTFVGYKYDRYQTETRWVAQQTVSIPACTDAANCSLTPITVSNFTDLTSITVEAEVNGHATIWWADDLAFGWFDNTCDAGLCRTNVPDGIMKSDWTIRPRQAASKLISLIGFRGW